MRQLTEAEQAAKDKSFKDYVFGWKYEIEEVKAYEAGFAAGLDFSADRIAALEAENKALADEYSRDYAKCAEYALKLQAENARLREALRPFTEYATTLTNWDSDPVVVAKWGGIRVTTGDFRKAAATLDNPT